MTSTIRVLSAQDIDHLLHQGEEASANEVMDLMAMTFATYTAAHQSGNTHIAQAPQRIGVHTDNHYALFMPSRLQQTTSIKVVCVPTNDGKGGLPATVLVLDEATGQVKAIMNGAALTAVRTAAGKVSLGLLLPRDFFLTLSFSFFLGSGLATRLFANPQAKNAVIFGAGAQGQSHIDMIIAARPSLEHISIWNRSPERRDALIKLMQTRYPTRTFTGINDDATESAVRQAQIVCTCTNATQPVLFGAWLSPGTHLNLVGSYRMDMHEVDTKTIQRADTIVVDSVEACGHEAGELVLSSKPEQWVEMGSVVNTTPAFDPHRITLFKSVGISVQDSAIAGLMIQKAEQEQLGVSAPF
jgi:ornithine cyclodeaminase